MLCWDYAFIFQIMDKEEEEEKANNYFLKSEWEEHGRECAAGYSHSRSGHPSLKETASHVSSLADLMSHHK